MSSSTTPIRGEHIDAGGSGFRNVTHPLAAVTMDGTTNDRPAWAALDTAWGYDVPRGTSLINTNLTLSVKKLRAAPGAKLKPASGAVVTLDCEIEGDVVALMDTSAGGSFAFTSTPNNRLGPRTRFSRDSTHYLELVIDTGGVATFSGGFAINPVAGATNYLSVARTVTASGHTFFDGSTITTAPTGFACYDTVAATSGSNNFDHFHGYQSRVSHAGTGQITGDLAGYTTSLSIGASAGAVAAVYGYWAQDVTGAGPAPAVQIAFFASEQTKGTDSYAVFTAGATKSYFGGNVHFNLRVGVGAAADAATGLRVDPAGILTGASQIGIATRPTISSAATGSGMGLYARVDTAAASFTVGNLYVAYLANPFKGAGSAVTVATALQIEAITAGVTNYAIHSLGGLIRFQGLPTSASGLAAGTLWVDSGTLKVA